MGSWWTQARTRLGPMWPSIYWVLTLTGAAFCVLAIAGVGGIGGVAATSSRAMRARTTTPRGTSLLLSRRSTGIRRHSSPPSHRSEFCPSTCSYGCGQPSMSPDCWAPCGLHAGDPRRERGRHPREHHRIHRMAIVLGLRHSAAWAFPLLTKVLPGVGMVWHVVRREWGSLAIATGVTLADRPVGEPSIGRPGSSGSPYFKAKERARRDRCFHASRSAQR